MYKKILTLSMLLMTISICGMENKQPQKTNNIKNPPKAPFADSTLTNPFGLKEFTNVELGARFFSLTEEEKSIIEKRTLQIAAATVILFGAGIYFDTINK